ncbi:hypothetical protein BRAS3843_700008 [Bradyrhizobium sp. STM 3843]|nr:hypothetical protein BRAS3843_700008 [Bradyrhizobium sp. STM 3843]
MRYFFEDFALDTERRELRRGADVVPTTPQVLDLLAYLILSRDRVVSKDDLIKAVWNGRIVSDAAVTTRLNAVRRAIGDSGEQQRLIKTFPRKGIRFVSDVREEDRHTATVVASDTLAEPSELAGSAGKTAVSGPDLSQKVVSKQHANGWLHHLRNHLRLVGGALTSIAAIGAIAGGLIGYWNVWRTVRSDVVRDAQKIQGQFRRDTAPRLAVVVLPFADLNNDPEQAHLADAITADLTAELARTPASFVVGRETAFAYKNKPIDLKQLGMDLGIRWAVRGAVKRNGDQVRVNVSLTDLQSARDIWSDRFDGDHANLAILRDKITARLLCVAYLHLRQYEEAVEPCSRSLNMTGVDFQPYPDLISAYRPTGQMEKARARPVDGTS